MKLEAVWLKNGEEIYKVSPVVNIVCYDDMDSVKEIEVEDDEYVWHSCDANQFDADDFIIRIKND